MSIIHLFSVERLLTTHDTKESRPLPWIQKTGSTSSEVSTEKAYVKEVVGMQLHVRANYPRLFAESRPGNYVPPSMS